MQAVGATYLALLLAGVALVAGATGFLGAVVIRRRSRRTRTIFTAGFVCGAAAAAIFDVRRRGIPALAMTYRRLGLGRWTPRRNGIVGYAMSSMLRAHILLRDAVSASSANKY